MKLYDHNTARIPPTRRGSRREMQTIYETGP